MHRLTENYIGDLAVEALLFEAGTTPKPGLVDRENNGAHQDMDYPLFCKSSEALRSCFRQCAEAGADAKKLRETGRQGEAAMYEATKHVNTHKGLIFSMGILCGALGEYTRQGEAFDEQALQQRCAQLAGELLADDPASGTHGLDVLQTTGIKGIRGEALSGFASAFQVGLLTLRRHMQAGYTLERAAIMALLTLMAETEDSNLVHRGGEKGLRFVQTHAGAMAGHLDLRRDQDLDAVRAFDEICIEKNLSPGGSADLLALSIMLYFVFDRIGNEG